MRFTAATLAVLATSVFAYTLEGRQSPFPACALTCIQNANLGGCVATDTSCTCKNQQFIDSTTRCIYANCTGSDLTTAVSTAQQICRAVGVTLTSTPILTSTATGTGTGSSNSSGAAATQTSSSTSSPASASSTSKSNDAAVHFNGIALASALSLIGVSISLM